MANSYVCGSLVRLSVAFSDAEGKATDPTEITLQVKGPDGTVTTYTHGVDAEVEKDEAGQYHLDLEITASGPWHYRWAGTGACTAAGEGWLYGLVSSVL